MHDHNQQQFISNGSIPLIDLKPFIDGTDEDSVVKQIASACQHIGFFGICRHGVSSQIMDTLCAASMSFFNLPKTEKESSMSTNVNEYPYGYEAMENLALTKENHTIITQDRISDDATLSVDIKETFSLGPSNPESGMPPRKIPANPPSLGPAMTAYYSAMEELTHTLAQIMALALDLPRNYFLEKMDRHQCALRLLNYPSVSAEPGFIRAGAHTDYGAFTILKSGGPGLQVFLQQNSIDSESNPAYKWTDIPESWHDKSIFIVNLGDMMQRWTNDKWISTLHRVVVSSRKVDEVSENRRQSIAFFVNINGDALVETIPSCVNEGNPLSYEPIQAGQYVLEKYLKSIGMQKDVVT